MSGKLKSLLEKARLYKMSSEEREAQHISFAFGNAKFENENVTRDGIVRVSAELKVLWDQQDPER